MIATTTVTVLSGTESDEFGDAKDNLTPSATGVPASILEQQRIVFDPSSGRLTPVRLITGRVPALTVITDNDRIKDEGTGQIYIVDSVDQPQSPVTTLDIRLELRRITSAQP